MKYNSLLIFIGFIFTNIVFGSESGAHHEPSVWDLKYPFLNFVLLAGFIVFKAKKPLAEMFDKKSQDVKTLMESAEKQSRDANAKLNELEGKIKNIETELVKINGDYEKDAVNFAKNQSDETATTIARMKRDFESKLEGEKNELNDSLSHELLSQVISKSKNAINTNSDLKTKATTNIIAGMK